MEPRILHGDSRLVVVDKPSGLLSVPGRGPDKQDSLILRLQTQLGPLLVPHRLDRDTSGVLVLARDAAALRSLGRQFQRREITRTYIALVYGRTQLETGRITLPLARDLEHPPRYKVDYVRGLTAVTDYRVLDRQPATRLELRPQTGRSHQLRVHLAALGHPVLGDPLYAHAEALAMADRLCLHAETISLSHPDDGRRVWFEAPTPF
ncbi:MAG: RluA family pseudouridine synthase [Planctomycetia bacterium]|nr:RluA family pseudouridine synthase [Planctomycetia bacterium]